MGQYLIGYPHKSYPRLTHFGYSDETRNYDSGMHRHIGYEFVFFFSGRTGISVKEKEPPLFLSGDDLLIMAPGIPHKFATPPEPLSYAWFGFQTGARVAGITDKLMFPEDTDLDRLTAEELGFTEDRDANIEGISQYLTKEDIQVVHKVPQLREPLEQIKREVLEPGPFGKEMIHIKILEILTLVLRKLKSRPRSAFNAAADFIRAHSQEQLNLSRIADYAGYQPSYFSRRFSQLFGVSPMRYVRQCRIQRAKVLLGTGTGITAVSESCGFRNVSYFNRVFKEETGRTPGAYARM